MQIARNALALAVALLQAGAEQCRQLPAADPHGQRQRSHYHADAQQFEPGGLQERRCDVEAAAGWRAAPDAIFVGCFHLEAVMARCEVGVIGARARAGLLPSLVHAGQSIAVAVALRPRQRQRDIVDLQLGSAGRQAQSLLQRGLCTAIQHVTDAHARRHGVDVRLPRVQPRQALIGGKPQQAISSQYRSGDGAALQGDARHAVNRVEQAGGYRLVVAQCAAQGGNLKPHQAAAAVEP
ncbi:hypothetical protein D3C75_909050 [compost metagenome]